MESGDAHIAFKNVDVAAPPLSFAGLRDPRSLSGGREGAEGNAEAVLELADRFDCQKILLAVEDFLITDKRLVPKKKFQLADVFQLPLLMVPETALTLARLLYRSRQSA